MDLHVEDVNVDSLYQKSCIAYLSILWNQPCIIKHLKAYLFVENSKRFEDIEKDVWSIIEKKSYLPEVLKLKLRNFIQPMGKQILHFIKIAQGAFLQYATNSSILNISFIWSDKGILNLKETAEAIIHNNPAYLLMTLCLSWEFCIEDSVSKLESKFVDLHKREFDSVFKMRYGIIDFWFSSLCARRFSKTTILKEVNKTTAEEFVFSYLENFHNMPLLKFFIEKMSGRLKYEVIFTTLQCIKRKTRPREGLALQYLLSKCHLQTSVNSYISQNAYKVLSCYLEWPCLDIFLVTLKKTWDYLSQADHLHLTLDIAECIEEYDMSYYYQYLFYRFWESTPVTYKEYIYQKCISGSFLSRIIHLRNTDDIVKFILEDTVLENTDHKQQMIFYFENMNLCDWLIKNKRTVSLKILVTSCIPNAEILNEFITQYTNYLPIHENNNKMTPRRSQFCETAKDWFEMPVCSNISL